MKRQRYSEEQIIGILKEAEAGVPLAGQSCTSAALLLATFLHSPLLSFKSGGANSDINVEPEDAGCL